MSWVLVLFISIGWTSEKDSMTMTQVPMASEQFCKSAGQAAVTAFDKGTKEVKFVCVKSAP